MFLLKSAEDVKTVPDAQDRLETVWQSLKVPDSQRLDMAIKYSCNEYFSQLSEVCLITTIWKFFYLYKI